ncbi:MAG: type II CAAX prenyl endopeptidase Rce1 family protein [Kofleriaceae bacterium]
MTIPTGPRTNSLYHASEVAAGTVFSAGRATAVLLASFGGYLVAAVVLASAGVGMIVTIIGYEAVLLLIPVAIARGHRGLLGLRRPDTRFIVAALLIGSSQWILNLVVHGAIADWIDLSQDGIARLEEVAVDPPLGLSLFAIALVPSICEEVLFRGVFARGLATRFVPAVAIVVSAAMFSAFHLSPIQAVPTFLLGLVYGSLALASRSCIPTILAHLLNNTLAILVAQDVVPWLAYDTYAGAGVALVLTASGLAIAIRGRP